MRYEIKCSASEAAEMRILRQEHMAGEAVLRAEFDQIARNLTLRIDGQRECLKQLTAAHRSTWQAKRQLVLLGRALERVDALRSRLN